MRALQTWGANLMIATEFEIELVKRAEPYYCLIQYPLKKIKDDETLLERLVDFALNVNDEEYSCGLFFMTDMLPHNVDAVSLKCIDCSWIRLAN